MKLYYKGKNDEISYSYGFKLLNFNKILFYFIWIKLLFQSSNFSFKNPASWVSAKTVWFEELHQDIKYLQKEELRTELDNILTNADPLEELL